MDSCTSLLNQLFVLLYIIAFRRSIQGIDQRDHGIHTEFSSLRFIAKLCHYWLVRCAIHSVTAKKYSKTECELCVLLWVVDYEWNVVLQLMVCVTHGNIEASVSLAAQVYRSGCTQRPHCATKPGLYRAIYTKCEHYQHFLYTVVSSAYIVCCSTLKTGTNCIYSALSAKSM